MSQKHISMYEIHAGVITGRLSNEESFKNQPGAGVKH